MLCKPKKTVRPALQYVLLMTNFPVQAQNIQRRLLNFAAATLCINGSVGVFSPVFWVCNQAVLDKRVQFHEALLSCHHTTGWLTRNQRQLPQLVRCVVQTESKTYGWGPEPRTHRHLWPRHDAPPPFLPTFLLALPASASVGNLASPGGCPLTDIFEACAASHVRAGPIPYPMLSRAQLEDAAARIAGGARWAGSAPCPRPVFALRRSICLQFWSPRPAPVEGRRAQTPGMR